MNNRKKLEDLNREELLATTRRLLAEADTLSSRIAAVNEISVAINKSLDLDKILRVVGKQAKWILDFDHCSVCLMRDDQWTVIPLFGNAPIPDVPIVETKNIGQVLKKRYPQIIHDGLDCIFLADYHSQMILPIESSEVLLGTINFAIKGSKKYTQEDIRIAYMLALQLSSAIRNAQIVEKLNNTQAELELRIEDLDAYNHTIAHDLKSPLSTILLSAQFVKMLTKGTLNEKAQRSLNAVEYNTLHMSEMIDRLLWLAKLRQDEIELVQVYVLSAIEKVKGRFASDLEEQNITLTIETPIPPALGQAQWVEEVIANFLSNAIKYIGADNPDPQIKISGHLKDNVVRYEITDNGIGIKAEDQKTLFEMFSRVEGSPVEGTGIGLSIVSRIIKRMNGTCGVKSIYGEGSTFWFELDAVIANDASVNSMDTTHTNDR